MQIFLSAVSSEFGSARRELSHDFRTRGVAVVLQEELNLLVGARTLLELLDTHIRDCTAVVCVIGRRSGAGFPSETEGAPYAHLLPPGMTRASYTQWEFILGHHHAKTVLACRPRPDAALAPDVQDADLTEPDDGALQAALVRHVEAVGVPRIAFSDTHELCRMVIRQPWVPAAVQATAAKPIALPYASIGADFKGRADFLARLHATLGHSSQTAITSAVHGLGGIGKTCAAIEYAWAHVADYTALLFVQADPPAALETNLARLAEALDLPEAAATDVPAQAHAVRRWLGAHPGWLLILDNADSPEALRAIEATLGRLPHGHRLITTRLSQFPAGIAALELGLLAEPDAIAVLTERTDARRHHAPDDAATARTLAVQDLDRLPLALEHAVAYINRLGCSFAAYRAALHAAPAAVLDHAKVALTHYDRTIARTWQTSVARLSPTARALLERLAFLAPDPVPPTLFAVPVPNVPAEDLTEALAELTDYSLAGRQPDGAGVTVHRLVQQVTRATLDPSAHRTRLTEALGWVNAAFEGDAQDVRTWPVLDPLAPHAEAVAGHADAAGIAAPTARLMSDVGNLFHAKAQHARAEPLLRRALAIDEASYGPDHPNVAIDLNNLATLLQDTNRLAEAEPLLRRALAIDEASYGPDHSRVAIELNNLAQLLRATNRLAEAEPLMRRALAIDEASYGRDHPDVARDLNNLASLLQATNRLAEAEPLMRRALAIDEASYGPDHPRVAVHLNTLAQLLQDTNRLAEAEPLMRRALAIDEASYGPGHPDVARDLNNLAQLLQATNRLAEAEPLIRRALAIDEASYGPGHPDVARDLNNLAMLLWATNRLAEAEPLMRRALAIDEASYGPDHTDVAIRLNNLAQLLQETNRLAEAEPPMRRMVIIFLKFQRGTGHAHPHRDIALSNYAFLLQQMGRDDAGIAAAIASAHREAGIEPP